MFLRWSIDTYSLYRNSSLMPVVWKYFEVYPNCNSLTKNTLYLLIKMFYRYIRNVILAVNVARLTEALKMWQLPNMARNILSLSNCNSLPHHGYQFMTPQLNIVVLELQDRCFLNFSFYIYCLIFMLYLWSILLRLYFT